MKDYLNTCISVLATPIPNKLGSVAPLGSYTNTPRVPTQLSHTPTLPHLALVLPALVGALLATAAHLQKGFKIGLASDRQSVLGPDSVDLVGELLDRLILCNSVNPSEAYCLV